ncbi:MAG: hypothetical protein JST46_11185 [Bacteroidetes bacterium]|nr:hypothetical protein [Bacteroidota bacterium]
MSFLIVALAVTLLLVLIILKLNPMLALIVVSLVTGLMLGMTPAKVVHSIQTGVGETMAGLALVLGLGAMFGKMIEISGAAKQISDTLLRIFGKNGLPWAMMLTGLMVGIPLFYNAGFVIMVPLVFSVARASKVHLLWVAIPLCASMSVAHGYLPPHPGPLAIASIFKADIGKTLAYGLVLTLPAVIIAGPGLAPLVRRIPLATTDDKTVAETTQPPSVVASFVLSILPVFLIASATALRTGFKVENSWLELAGEPVVALLFSLVLAGWILGINRGMKMKDLMSLLQESIAGIAMMMLIIASGGAFKQVLVDSGVAKEVADKAMSLNLSPLLMAWSIAALVRICVGSATVAGLMAAGIVSSMAQAPGAIPELMVLSIGAGSLMFSHVNDTGFWMFKEYFNLTLRQTFLSWSLMETLVSVIGLAGVLILNGIAA